MNQLLININQKILLFEIIYGKMVIIKTMMKGRLFSYISLVIIAKIEFFSGLFKMLQGNRC